MVQLTLLGGCVHVGSAVSDAGRSGQDADKLLQVKDCESRGEGEEVLGGGQQCTTSAED